MNVYQHL